MRQCYISDMLWRVRVTSLYCALHLWFRHSCFGCKGWQAWLLHPCICPYTLWKHLKVSCISWEDGGYLFLLWARNFPHKLPLHKRSVQQDSGSQTHGYKEHKVQAKARTYAMRKRTWAISLMQVTSLPRQGLTTKALLNMGSKVPFIKRYLGLPKLHFIPAQSWGKAAAR